MTTFDPLDRSTWPDVLTHDDLRRVLRIGRTTLFERKRLGMLPPSLPALSSRDMTWSRTAVCEWLDHQRINQRGLRRVS